MARLHGHAHDTNLNSVSMEEWVKTTKLSMKRPHANITCAGDSAERVLGGKYGWSVGYDGFAGLAAGESDVTLFAMLTSAVVAFDVLADGGSAVGAGNPKPNGNVGLESYDLTYGIGDGISFSAGLVGDGALTRAVA